MKTSKYIIIAIVAFVLVAELILYIDAYDAHKNGRNAYPNYTVEVDEQTQTVQAFNSIKVYPNIDVKIKNAKEYKIKYTYYKDSTVTLPQYRIENNVLHIDTVPNNNLNITLYAPEIKSIEGMSDNRIVLYSYSTHDLNILINKGRLRNHGRDTIKCSHLKIKAIDSRVSFYGKIEVDKIEVDSDASNIHFNIRGRNKGSLKAILNNKSRMDTDSFSDMQIKRDTTSKIYVR